MGGLQGGMRKGSVEVEREEGWVGKEGGGEEEEVEICSFFFNSNRYYK